MPDDPLIAFNRGLVAFLQGEIKQAIMLCQNALQTPNAALKQQMWDTLESDPMYADLLPALT